MLYIENIDDCNFKMYGDAVSQTGLKILSKMEFKAVAMEPGYLETIGRISIKDGERVILNHKPVSQISLDGVVHATAEAFVVAFNNLMAQCCCGASTNVTTVAYCNDCNDWSIGSVDNDSKVFAASTLNSITIIVESGTVNVSNGTENADLIEGESVTYTASTLLTQAVTIDATNGKAIYAIITCATTTTTTVAPTTTTTTQRQ